MTPNDIISEALEIQGDTDLTTRARVWLNRLIEQIAYLNKSKANAWNKKESSVSLASNTRTYSLPARILHVADWANYIDSENVRTPVRRYGYEVLESESGATTDTGDPPAGFAWDTVNSLWVVFPVPTKSGTLKIPYWERPADINFAANGGAELTGSFPHHLLLVEAIANIAGMYQAEKALDLIGVARRVQAEAAVLSIDTHAGKPAVRLDRTVFFNQGA